MTTASGSHLSIGEVLALLQEDFPDVTISKIRFLESQGLIDPERTPSGYRKFYEADIARLRWILTQQRENFLPLKVIKDRLAAGEVDFSADLAPDAAPEGQAAGAPAPAGVTPEHEAAARPVTVRTSPSARSWRTSATSSPTSRSRRSGSSRARG